jgi:pyruvate,water dikinase
VHGLVGSLRRLASGPLDVEWAFDGERLWLLQARPVTTRTLPLPVRDSATGVYDNSNIVESYPGVVSPLTFSFAQYAYSRVYAAFVRLLGVPAERVAAHRPVFDNMLARVHGRAYYRLDNWRRALMLLPGYGLNSGYMDAMMGLDEPFPDGVVETPPRPRGMALAAEILGVAKGAAGMVLAAVRLPSMRDAFLARLESVMAESGDRVETASLVRLAAVYRSVEARLLDRWDAPLVNDFLCMVAFGASRRIAESWLGPAGLELHNACMIGQGDIVSAEPVRRIAQMAVLVRGDPALVAALDRGDEDAILGNPSLATCLKAYVEKFGDRSPGELKLESPTLADDPSSLYRAVAGAARRAPPDEGAPVIVRYALGSLLPRSPVKRLLLGTLLGYAKARVRDRENLRFERTRVFGLARRVFRAMGAQFHALGLLDDPRDVFLLTVGECLGAVEGGGVDFDLRSLAALRRAEAAGYPPENPPTRFMVRGALAASIDVVVPAEAEIDSDPGGPVRKGFACSDGRVVGVARVVEDPRTQRIGDGEILVARSTDPGWIALFANAGAVVVERGSPLSHSAIVSRELGIPCVVAVKNATRWIADGDRIAVDGRAGTVEKLPAKESANG